MKKTLLTLVVLTVAILLVLAAQKSVQIPLVGQKPAIIAVIDTGITPEAALTTLKDRLTERPYRNFFDDNENIDDENGHGTRVARTILQSADHSARILPIKIARNRAGVRPADLAKALRHAASSGASIINFSFGLSEGSDELQAAVSELQSNGIVLVTAAGSGLINPFKPVSIDKIYPQAYGQSLVVGWALRSASATGGASPNPQADDPTQNFGKQLSILLLPPWPQNGGSFLPPRAPGEPEERASGSSFAAAWMSGYLSGKGRPALLQSKSGAAIDYEKLRDRIISTLRQRGAAITERKHPELGHSIFTIDGKALMIQTSPQD